MRTMKHLALAAAAASALALAGCGGGGSSATSQQQPVPAGPPAEQQPTPYEKAKAEIAEATTAAAAQAAYNAVKGDVTAEQGEMLQAAVAQRTAALAAMARAPVDNALAAIAAATTAAGAQAAYDAVKDDVTAAQGAELQAAVDARQTVLATMARANDQKMALMNAAGAVDTSDLSTVDAITAANTLIANLRAALNAAADVSDADKAMYQTQLDDAEAAVATAQAALDTEDRMMVQRSAIMDAVAAVRTAVAAVNDTATDAQVTAAEKAVADLKMAIDGAADIPEGDGEVASAQGTLTTLEGQLESAKTSRTAAMEAEQDRIDTASQTMALEEAVAALGMVDLDNLMTQAQIDAANEAIIALDLALEAATNLTAAQKLDALTDVTLAKRKVEAAETVLAENVGTQREAVTAAKTALDEIDLDDLDTAEKIAAANQAVETLKMALAEATHLSDAAKAMYQTQLDTATETVRTAQTGMALNERMTAQRTAITNAVTMARTAVGMVDDDATDDQVTAADEAVAALQAAIDEAVDLGEGDTNVAEAKGTLATLEPQLAAAKTSRMAAMEAKQKETDTAMAATAAKLYAAVSPASGDGSTETADARFADITPVSATDPTPFISVNYGGELETAGQANSATLNLDKDATVADHRGWKGNRYVEKDANGNVITEAVVYSDESPTMGKKFGGAAANGEFEYALVDGMITVDATATGDDLTAPRVGGAGFSQSAGIKEFPLPTSDPSGPTKVVVPGTYHGVAGTYSCTPTTGNTCAADKAATGFTLGQTANADNAFTASADAWTFKPANANARVTDAADDLYAVYGWWLRTPAGNGAWTASAFDGYYGTPVEITGLTALNGSATYTGGAAGKYALSSSTGGTNEAGHFTARATLEADFNAEMITGTIDNFMGDGEAKDWSVELMKSAIGATGLIRQSDDDNSDLAAGDPGAKTKWTIGDNAAAASGHWKGNFREVGDNGVPAVVTGDFYSEFGTSGKMVGAFGAKTE